MLKLFKCLASLITALVLLLLIAVIALPQFINPNDYKDEITQALKQHSGLNVSIDGELSLSVFPWLGVKVEHITVLQPHHIQAVKDKPLAKIAVADVKVQLKPLFSGHINIDTVVLTQPVIHFVVAPNGTDSLTALAQQPQQTTPNAQQKSTQQKSPTNKTNSTSQVATLSLAGVNISNGTVFYHDLQTHTTYRLSELTISGGNVLAKQVAPFSVYGVLEQLSGPNDSEQLEATTLSLTGQLMLDQHSLAATAQKINVNLQQQQMRVTTKIQQVLYDHQSAQANINALDISGNFNNIAGNFGAPTLLVDIKNTALNIPSFNAKAFNVQLNGNLKVRNWNSTGLASGFIETNTFDATSLLNTLDIDYQATHKNALQKVSFTSHFNGTGRGVSLKQLQLNIDKTTLSGDIAISNFAQPNYDFDLSLGNIVVDDYLPVKQAETAQSDKDTPADIRISSLLVAPIALLQEINANGVFRSNTIKANNIIIDSSTTTIQSTPKQSTLNIEAALYQGVLNTNVALEKTTQAKLSIAGTLNNIALKPLLKDAELTEKFSGTGDIKMDIVVQQSSAKSSLSNSGMIKVMANDGILAGVNVKKLIREARRVSGKDVSTMQVSKANQTEFDNISATLLLNNDVITNNDLFIKAATFSVTGKGKVNTAKNTINYASELVDERANLTIPVITSGTLSDPQHKIDARKLLKANTKKAVNKEKAKLKDKLLKKLGVEPETDNTDDKKQDVKEQLKEKLKQKLFDKLF